MTSSPSVLFFRGGQPYSYCGINDREVCCFVPENAEPVGILPTPTRSRCGQKGFDTGSEGEADMAEWPWHVSSPGGDIGNLFVPCIFLGWMKMLNRPISQNLKKTSDVPV